MLPVNDPAENPWQKRYLDHDTPWDRDVVNPHVQEFVQLLPLRSSILDAGCGTGTTALWLAGRGFRVTGIDIAPMAIEMASVKALKAGLPCRFITGDFLAAAFDKEAFDAAFDSGCFHVFDSATRRSEFTRKLFGALKPGAFWLSFVASADTPPRISGPPPRSATEIVEAVEPFFEILSLRADPDGTFPYRFWIVLMRKRSDYRE
jgi:SAM-dependent methyltransferase